MATDAERYLKKARESLASAKADVRARRFNSAANRAYYAAFQAAVAALLHWDVRPAGTVWEHRFVPAEFSRALINRRKVFAGELTAILGDLFNTRIIADYEATEATNAQASRAVKLADKMVTAIDVRMSERVLREASPEYGKASEPLAAVEPKEYVEQVKARILESYPGVEFRVRERGPRDFTIDVYGDYDEVWAVTSVADLTTEILENNDVWIVVLPHDRRPGE